MASFKISYDYRCPFANNLHRHVITALRAGGDFAVEFIPWTMSQGYRAPGASDVWDDPAKDADHLALAVSVSIRDQQSERFLDVHEALFRARHEAGANLKNWNDIEVALRDCAVDLASVRQDVASRRPYDVIGQCFKEFERYEAFGVPTMVVDEDATFVRYMKGPSEDANASVTLVTSLISLINSQGDLNEFKHTKVPF